MTNEVTAVSAAVAQALPVLPIRLNTYLNIRPHPKTGDPQLFGKIGYQTMHKDLDRITMTNMCDVSRAMAAGELLDINGEVATDGCIIETLSIVNLVDVNAVVESNATIRTLGGKEVTVPAAPAPVAGKVPNPFGG